MSAPSSSHEQKKTTLVVHSNDVLIDINICSFPVFPSFLSRPRRLQNIGCLTIKEFLNADLMESVSASFLKPTAQWIMKFVSGRRNSLPEGVTGSSESLSGVAIGEVRARAGGFGCRE